MHCAVSSWQSGGNNVKPTLWVEARSDVLPLLQELNKTYRLVAAPPTQTTALSTLPVGDYTVGGVNCTPYLKLAYPDIAAQIAVAHNLIDVEKPVGCVLWNTVQPRMAAFALTCHARGVPVYEVNHWSLANHLIGHFEDVSLADYIYCAEEYATFWRARHHLPTTCTPIVVGKPVYDTWQTPRDRMAVRRALGLPENKIYILKTSTWTHTFTEWSHNDWTMEHEMAMLNALHLVQQHLPVAILWSLRATKVSPEVMGERLEAAGLKDVYITNDTGIRDLIEAADVVLSHKSGAAVDAVVLGRPAIIVDFKPQLDAWLWSNKGIRAARTPEQVLQMLVKVLTDKKWRQRMLQEGEKWKSYFGATGHASKQIVEHIGETCLKPKSSGEPDTSRKPTALPSKTTRRCGKRKAGSVGSARQAARL